MHVYLTKAWCRLFYLDRKKICRDTSVCAQAGNNRWHLIKGIAQVLRPLCQAWRALLYLLPGWAPSRSLCQYNNHSTCCTEKYRTVWLVTMVIKKKRSISTTLMPIRSFVDIMHIVVTLVRFSGVTFRDLSLHSLFSMNEPSTLRLVAYCTCVRVRLTVCSAYEILSSATLRVTLQAVLQIK